MLDIAELLHRERVHRRPPELKDLLYGARNVDRVRVAKPTTISRDELAVVFKSVVADSECDDGLNLGRYEHAVVAGVEAGLELFVRMCAYVRTAMFSL